MQRYHKEECMSFTDDFTACITGKTLPPELARLIPDPQTAMAFASKLIKGASVEEALIAIGVGAELAADVAAAVAAFTVGVIVGAVVGCAVNAASGSLGGVLAQMDSSDQEALQGPLADAGFVQSDTAAA